MCFQPVVLERWIADRPFRFAQAPASSDLDAARGERAQRVLDEHWSTWISEQDWAWIAEQGINTVRIPVRVSFLNIRRDGISAFKFKLSSCIKF
jgi:aryl-phospho-beta-D-glucosidase BglC (GH1 family)